MDPFLALSTFFFAAAETAGPSAAQTAGIAAGTGVVGILSTLAILKWRADHSEAVDERQDQEQKATSQALNELTSAVKVQTAEVKNEINESEKRTDAKLKDLTKTISRKIEGLKEIQSEHTMELAVLKNDQKHLKDKVIEHDRDLSKTR